jgi:hypothetical protein
MNASLQALEDFINGWQETDAQTKKAFLQLKESLAAKEGAILDFVPREGVTYSLRAAHRNQKDRTLFVMVDVIEEHPRWLSVCFYSEMISDPEEKGDFVPQGLLGEDAACFDVETYSPEDLDYLEARLAEAHAAAAKG